jgi:hypothetical protein
LPAPIGTARPAQVTSSGPSTRNSGNSPWLGIACAAPFRSPVPAGPAVVSRRVVRSDRAWRLVCRTGMGAPPPNSGLPAGTAGLSGGPKHDSAFGPLTGASGGPVADLRVRG